LIENHFENRFQTKQASLPTFTKQDFGATCGLDSGLSNMWYECLQREK
jgi:hypothetical protein